MTRTDHRELEDRLRDAYGAAARTVEPGTARPLAAAPAGIRTRPGRRFRAAFRTGRDAGPGDERRPRRGAARRIGVPAAAAAAVAVITAAAALAASGTWAGRAPAAGPSASRQASGPVRAGAAAPPAYLTALVVNGATARARVAPSPQAAAAEVTAEVIAAATGQVTGRLPGPPPGRLYQAVTALGGDRSFLVAQEPASPAPAGCATWLYRFRVSARGRPGRLTLVRRVRGLVLEGSLTASATGKVIAYATTGCGASLAPRVIVDRLAGPGAGIREWTVTTSPFPLRLSLSGDGSVLGIASPPPALGFGPASNELWALRTNAPPGPLLRRARRLIDLTGLAAMVTGPGGSEVITALTEPGAAIYRKQLAAFTTASGKPRGIFATLPGSAPGAGVIVPPRLTSGSLLLAGLLDLAFSHSGRYLLVTDWARRAEVLDMRTRQFTELPVPRGAGTLLSAAW